MAQLWGGRFTKETDKLVYNFNASISFDQKFYEQDIRGSKAHVKMLAKQGILTEDEKNQIIAGLDKNFQGEVVFSPGYTVGYLEQEPQLDDSKTVREVVEEGCAATVALLKEYEQINQQLCEPMDDDTMARLVERQGELYEQIDHAGGWELDNVLERAMDALRCPDPDQSVKVLSGGERRRVALCRLLLQQPDVLLLDEPTNHLDAESIDWLEQHLQQYKGTVIAVTHDRYFLDNVAGWILELDRGEGIPWKGNYSGWLDQKTTRMAMEEKQESKRRKTLERELEWVRMSPSGRHAKSKARLSAYDKMMNEDTKQKEEKLEIFIPNGPRLGDVVIEAHDVSKAFGDRVLYEGLDLTGLGHIALVTYIRTDSTRVSAEATAKARETLAEKYGEKYVPQKPNIYKSRKNSQDAHEAIRPINLELTPESLKDKLQRNQYRLYKLIYERFLASQAAKAVYDSVNVTIKNGDYAFKSTGKTMTFDGYTRIYAAAPKEEAGEDNEKIPPLADGEKLELSKLSPEQKFTKPPAKYTEASLIKLLEDKGIGRPSTFATILSTLGSWSRFISKSISTISWTPNLPLAWRRDSTK